MNTEKADNPWTSFIRARRAGLVSFPIIIASGIALGVDSTFGFEGIIAIILALGIITFVSSVLFTTFWPCPRCKEFYTTTWGTNWPYISKCVHCGLPFRTSDINQHNPIDS